MQYGSNLIFHGGDGACLVSSDLKPGHTTRTDVCSAFCRGFTLKRICGESGFWSKHASKEGHTPILDVRIDEF